MPIKQVTNRNPNRIFVLDGILYRNPYYHYEEHRVGVGAVRPIMSLLEDVPQSSRGNECVCGDYRYGPAHATCSGEWFRWYPDKPIPPEDEW
jgi:hypothetical protein